MFTETFYVPDISCHQCEAIIERAMLAAEGVSSVSVDLPAKRVTMSYDLPTTENTITDLMNQIGYPLVAPHG